MICRCSAAQLWPALSQDQPVHIIRTAWRDIYCPHTGYLHICISTLRPNIYISTQLYIYNRDQKSRPVNHRLVLINPSTGIIWIDIFLNIFSSLFEPCFAHTCFDLSGFRSVFYNWQYKSFSKNCRLGFLSVTKVYFIYSVTKVYFHGTNFVLLKGKGLIFDVSKDHWWKFNKNHPADLISVENYKMQSNYESVRCWLMIMRSIHWRSSIFYPSLHCWK